MWDPQSIKKFTVVTGHYGSGKTNFSINLAIDIAASGHQVTLVDLDIVNPYFRSSDYAQNLAQHNIQLIAPTFAGTTLDTPSLSPAVYSVFEKDGYVIFDVGGDDVGATALGRYKKDIAKLDYDLLYVINAYRNLTPSAAEAADLLREIEVASGLSATGIVNNSHLQGETTLNSVLGSVCFADEASKLTQLPLVCTTIPNTLLSAYFAALQQDKADENLYPVKRYVHAPWEDEPTMDEEAHS